MINFVLCSVYLTETHVHLWTESGWVYHSCKIIEPLNSIKTKIDIDFSFWIKGAPSNHRLSSSEEKISIIHHIQIAAVYLGFPDHLSDLTYMLIGDKDGLIKTQK